MKLLIYSLDSKFVLAPKSNICLHWKYLFSPTYTHGFSRATLQFLGCGCDNNLEWWMLFILVITSTILVLVTTLAHETTFTQLGNHFTSSTLIMALEDICNMDEIALF